MEGSLLGAAAAAGYLGAFQGAGVCLSRLALPRQSPAMRLLVGSVWGSLLLQWLPALFAFGVGFSLAAHWLALGCALLLGAGALFWGRGAPWGLRRALSPFARRKFLWAVALVWLFFCFLVWHGFRWEGGCIFSSQATYGDMSMHLSFLTSLAQQGTFPPEYSLLPGVRLSYPFLSDSVSSSLYLLGAPLWFAYQLPMWLAGAQVLFGAYSLFRGLSPTPGRAALAWVFFAFNGGLGVVYFLGGGPGNFTRIFTAFYETPTNLVGENIRWVNVLVDMMLPQRATLFGWAVLFPALWLLAQGVFAGEGRAFPLVGLMAGALPMVHTHSFLALGVICGGWMAFSLFSALKWDKTAVRVGKILIVAGLPAMAVGKELCRGREESPLFLWLALGAVGAFVVFLGGLALAALGRGQGRLLSGWGILLGITLALALPQLLFWTFRQAGTGGFLRGHFGWVIGEDGYLPFYLKNLGLPALLALGGLLAAAKGQFARCAPALALWLLAELIVFQPNDYDNNKLLYPAWALLCPAAADCLVRLGGWAKTQLSLRRGAAWAGAAAVAVSTCSAALTMGREAVASYELFGTGAAALAQWVQENTPADAVFLTNDRHNNEIAALAGRNVVCGSPSYLYYHGLPYEGNHQALATLYQEPATHRELFDSLGVDYILASDFERGSYQVDAAALGEMFPLVYDDGSRQIYAAKEMDR